MSFNRKFRVSGFGFRATASKSKTRYSVLGTRYFRRHIVLIGYRGAGKTTIGRILARRLKRPFIDTDQEVERAVGMSVARIFREKGERAFRLMESRQVARLACRNPSVVAVGGGALDRAANRRTLQRLGTLVWLDVSRAPLLSRLERQGRRPILAGCSYPAEMQILLPRRLRVYRACEDLRLRVGYAPPKILAQRIERYLQRISHFAFRITD